MSHFVHKYVRTCHVCSHAKASWHCCYGTLQLLPIPDFLWASISMDFIKKLLTSNGHDSIIIIVD